ncbi:MAG: hypothetical protein VX222_02035, partial [Actinomycetota bacterium]|nr:hypothetical protein [Actinomycetota bacterium]
GGGGLSGINVCHDADVSNAVKGMSAWHEKSASVSLGQGLRVLAGTKVADVARNISDTQCAGLSGLMG